MYFIKLQQREQNKKHSIGIWGNNCLQQEHFNWNDIRSIRDMQRNHWVTKQQKEIQQSLRKLLTHMETKWGYHSSSSFFNSVILLILIAHLPSSFNAKTVEKLRFCTCNKLNIFLDDCKCLLNK